jgi:hypothetical protein
MSGGDCLLWIDGDYPTVARFVAEAERRGCCRKVPVWPAWVSRGSRVFLAHRHQNVRTDTGSIFGYFPLRGVDVILSPQRCADYEALRSTFRTRRDDPEPLLAFWRDVFHGRGLPIDTRPRPHDDDTRRRPHDDDVVGFLLDFFIGCDGDGDGDGGFGRGIPTNQTDLEADRDCGSRPEGWKRDGISTGAADGEDGDSKPRPDDSNPAIYFVDPLAREIEDLFCEILKKLLEEKRTKRRVRTKDGRRRGIPEFDVAVREAAARGTSRPRIPAGLSGHARRRGSMIVFEEPYPSFRRRPRRLSVASCGWTGTS